MSFDTLNSKAYAAPLPGPAKAIAEMYCRDVLPRSGNNIARSEAGDALEYRLVDKFKSGNISFLDPEKGVDITEMVDRIYQHSKATQGQEKLAWAMDTVRKGDIYRDTSSAKNLAIHEHVVDGFSASQFARFIEGCTRLGAFEFCSGPDASEILQCVGRMQLSCDQDKLFSDFHLVDVEVAQTVEDEPTPSLSGIANPCEWGLQEPVKLKFAMHIKREMLCGDIGDRIRRLMEDAGRQLDRQMARWIVRLIFDTYTDTVANPWKMKLDGVDYDTYYQKCANGALPWGNLLYNQFDLECGDQSMFCMVEECFEDMIHPITGDPMDCCDLFGIVSTGDKQAMDIRDTLGAQVVQAGLKGPQNKVVQFTKPAREKWSPEIKNNRFIKKYLKEAYEEIYGATFTDDEICQAVDRTFLAGCPQQAFAMTVQWEREVVERSAPDTWEYFNQEIVYSRKYMEKVGLAVLQPWAVVLVQGWPDGQAIPNAVCCT